MTRTALIMNGLAELRIRYARQGAETPFKTKELDKTAKELYNRDKGGETNGTQKRSGKRRSTTFHADRKANEKHQRPAKGQPGRDPAVSGTNQRKEVTYGTD